jgi:hypothetical protein
MRSKRIIGVLIALTCLFALCLGNREQPKPVATTQAQTPQTAAPTTTIAANIPLDNMQIEACNSAELGGTCQTKLKEFGIVPLEECCKYLNKCC